MQQEKRKQREWKFTECESVGIAEERIEQKMLCQKQRSHQKKNACKKTVCTTKQGCRPGEVDASLS